MKLEGPDTATWHLAALSLRPEAPAGAAAAAAAAAETHFAVPPAGLWFGPRSAGAPAPGQTEMLPERPIAALPEGQTPAEHVRRAPVRGWRRGSHCAALRAAL